MEVDRDLVIIGAGAAGLSAAQYGARANLKVLVVEEMAPGGQSLSIDNLENYPGFPEPISGFEFTQRFSEQAKKFGAEFITATVTALKKEGSLFKVTTTKGEFTCYSVIMATGAKHRKLNVPGEDTFSGKGVSYCATCDGPFFKNKPMLVVGGGDAACDEAMYLSNLSDQIIQIHRRDRFRAQRALAERVLNNDHIDVRFNTVLKEIKGDSKVEKATLQKTDSGETYDVEVAAVFVFIGSDPHTSLVPDIKKDEAGYIVTDQRMETSVPGLYAVGDVRSSPFRQLVVSAGEGAIASHSASMHIDELKGQAYN